MAAEYAFFFAAGFLAVVPRAGVLVVVCALFVAGAAATAWAADTCGDIMTALAVTASDTAIFVKQFCFAIKKLIGL